MSVELLTNEHWSVLKNTLKNTKSNIRIISPFIGLKTAQLLKEIITTNNIKCKIITRFYREDFLNNASSLEGLRVLIKAGAEIYALLGLHTKLYLFDKDISIIGSANFTMGGFKLNHELSILASDEVELNKDLNEYFENVLKEIETNGEWKLDLDRIDEEIYATDGIIKGRKDKNIHYSNSIKFGADIKKKVDSADSDIIEKIVMSNQRNEKAYNSWFKFEGKGDNRLNSSNKYENVKIQRNQINITCFPRNPRSISNGDKVFLCALSYDKNDIATPMVVARARTKGFNSENVVEESMINEKGWMKEYPYYCELYDVEILDTEIRNCISLDNIIKEVGNNLYPNSIGTHISIAELKTRHHQKSHIRITSYAEDYIDNKFDELKAMYGWIQS